MNKIEWLELTKERIEAILHNGDNLYLRQAVKFINQVIKLIKEEDINGL